MKNKSDKQTFKLKKNPKKRKKDNDSNNSRDSLELTIKSYQENSKINHKDMGTGENIKFLFNEFPVNKTKISNNKFPKLNPNGHKGKEEFDFRELLLNYVNQTGRTNEKKSKYNDIGSVIYTKKNEVLTLNGENNNTNNNDEFSNQISKSSESKAKIISESNSEKKTQKEEMNKKLKEKKKKKEIKINKKITKNENNTKTLLNNNIFINKKEKIKNNKDKVKPIEKALILSDKKMKNSEKNIESVINSNYNKLTYSNKIIISNKNTFTTATNTQDSSFKSLKLDFKKKNYDYLNFSDLSLKQRLVIQNKLYSEKKNVRKNEEKDKKINEIKNKEENIFDKIRNLNISLEVEKSYCNYFSKIINLQKQNKPCQKTSDKSQKYSNKDGKSLHSNSQINKRYFYYPDEYYIDKNNNLHSKYHVSHLFDKLRNKI